MTSRRDFLYVIGASAASAAALTLWPGTSQAATGADTRLLVLMLRGGLDGLHAVPPWGDPAYVRLRGAMALIPGVPAAAGASPAAHSPALQLDSTFALHPSLVFARQLYGAGQFMPLVAAAPPYWGRSHFDAQDCVENGTAQPHGERTGWLNRAVAAMPGVNGLAIATVMPLMMRGPASVASWSPPLPLQINPVLLQRLEPLYGDDPRLAGPFAQAITDQGRDQAIDHDLRDASASTTDAMMTPGVPAIPKAMPWGPERLPRLMKAAGTFMARDNGPRIGFVEDYGWDTHANEAAILARKLKELDDGFAAFHAAATAVWARTVLIVVTEFGRTAAINGTNGTDHGTGGTLFLAGGAVRGGRVAGVWPGMATSDLYQQRDIHATTDIRAVFKAVLATHLALDEGILATRVFPGSSTLAPAEGLVGTPASAA